MPSIWANFSHVSEMFEGPFRLPLIAKRYTGVEVGHFTYFLTRLKEKVKMILETAVVIKIPEVVK